ncbi:S8 family serine peptidase, partial [bacterium]|nr:S8 family serine peptidase [bacterium]
MKAHSILAFSLALCSATHAATIQDQLQTRINTDGMSRVIISFRDRIRESRLRSLGSTREVKRTLMAQFQLSMEPFNRMLKSRRASSTRVLEEYWAANAVLAEVDNKMLSTLAENEEIEDISLDEKVALPILPPNPLDDEAEPPEEKKWTYGLKMMKVDEVRSAYTLTGKGVTVGIIDSGIDAEHPDLKGKVVAWADIAEKKATPRDANGHGTHVAGTIAGGDASGTHIGVAPEAKLIVARIFGDSGTTLKSIILKAMNWITDPDGDPNTDDHPRIVSNSWGGTSMWYIIERPYWKIVQAWRALDMVPVFAAGNAGPKNKTMSSPGSFPHSYAVGAVDFSRDVADFSSRGPVSWSFKKYIKPDISAPGVNVQSTWPGGGYKQLSGTSMAT